jgi:hypothetical protein
MRGAAPLAPGGLEPFPRAPSLSSVGPTPSAPFFFPVSRTKPSATPLPLLPPSKLRRDAVPTPPPFLRAAQRVRHQPPLPSTASNCCSGQSFHGISKFPHRGCLPRTGQRSRGFPQLREARRAPCRVSSTAASSRRHRRSSRPPLNRRPPSDYPIAVQTP